MRSWGSNEGFAAESMNDRRSRRECGAGNDPAPRQPPRGHPPTTARTDKERRSSNLPHLGCMKKEHRAADVPVLFHAAFALSDRGWPAGPCGRARTLAVLRQRPAQAALDDFLGFAH